MIEPVEISKAARESIRNLSIQDAAYLLGMDEEDRLLLKYSGLGMSARKTAELLRISEVQLQRRAEWLAAKLRMKLVDLDQLAKDFAKFAESR